MQYRLEIKRPNKNSVWIGINETDKTIKGKGLKTPRDVFRAVNRVLPRYPYSESTIGIFPVSDLRTPSSQFNVLIYLDNDSSDGLTNLINLDQEKTTLSHGWHAALAEKKIPLWKSLLLYPLIWPIFSILTVLAASLVAACASPNILLSSMSFFGVLAPILLMIGLVSLPFLALYAFYRNERLSKDERHPFTAYLTERLDWIEDYPAAAGIIWGSGAALFGLSILFSAAYFTHGFGALPDMFDFMGSILGFISHGLIAMIHGLATLPGLEGLASIPAASLATGCMIASAVILAVFIFLMTEALNRFANGITDLLKPSTADQGKGTTKGTFLAFDEKVYIERTQQIKQNLEKTKQPPEEKNKTQDTPPKETTSTAPARKNTSTTKEEPNKKMDAVKDNLNEQPITQTQTANNDAPETTSQQPTTPATIPVQQTIVEKPAEQAKEQAINSSTPQQQITQEPNPALKTKTDTNETPEILETTQVSAQNPPKQIQEGWTTENSTLELQQTAREKLLKKARKRKTLEAFANPPENKANSNSAPEKLESKNIQTTPSSTKILKESQPSSDLNNTINTTENKFVSTEDLEDWTKSAWDSNHNISDSEEETSNALKTDPNNPHIQPTINQNQNIIEEKSTANLTQTNDEPEDNLPMDTWETNVHVAWKRQQEAKQRLLSGQNYSTLLKTPPNEDIDSSTRNDPSSSDEDPNSLVYKMKRVNIQKIPLTTSFNKVSLYK
jgi:hypothetical protein